MPQLPITVNSVQVDPELYIITPPVSATQVAQTVYDVNLNVKIMGFMVNNTTGSAATLTITDGSGNEFITDASFDANQSQFVETKPGYYFLNGLAVSSDTDNALQVWLQAKKM